MTPPSLSIQIVTPAPMGSSKGNRVTAERWAGLLEQLGHKVRIVEQLDDQRCDVLVALHAKKSHAAISESARNHPPRPVILALTGTDLYDDIHNDASAQESLALSQQLIVLQQRGLDEIPPEHREKAVVIYQSVPSPRERETPKDDVFEVCVIGHLRDVKDPLRTAEASRLLPTSSRLRVVQMGFAYTDEYARRASREMETNPRYTWLKELPREECLQRLSGCRLLVLTSRSEGGANAISEALACDVPVVSSRIPGSTGMLGEDYPGYFPYGDTQALADVLYRAETDVEFYASLVERCHKKKWIADPNRERQSWSELLGRLRVEPE